jgi:hypothetical protein
VRCIALLSALLAACVSTAARERGPFTPTELIEVFVQWREAERRRDFEMAEESLQFERSSDRSFYRRELEYLQRLPSGTIMTEVEIHLVGYPADMGPGDYLFLEPARGVYHTTPATIVGASGGPRILYRRPELSAKELHTTKPGRLSHLAVDRRVTFWKSLSESKLTEEVDRLRRMLRYQVAAKEYAQKEGIALTTFKPEPSDILRDLDGLEPQAVRERVLAALQESTR